MSKRLQQIPQLNSLRGLAALLIVFYHFLPDLGLGHIPFGWVGVDIFFVVSGYLITAILLEQKEGLSQKLLLVRNFIIKRALRLFPIYYLFILFFFALMFFTGLYVCDRDDQVFYYTYTQNVLFFIEGMKGSQMNHLWTLAVEEQFYLLWPWCALFIGNKPLLRVLAVIIPASLLFKSVTDISNYRMLTFSHIDTLGGGALIALLLKENKTGLLLWLNRYKLWLIAASLIVLGTAAATPLPALITNVFILLLSAALVAGCCYSFTGLPGKLLNREWLCYLGLISYGIYLYHKPIPYFLLLLSSKLHFSMNSFALLAIALALNIIIAHFSYQLIEKWFLKKKHIFDL